MARSTYQRPISLKETRTDKIRPHIRGAHASYLPTAKDEPVTSTNDDGMDSFYNDASKQDTVSSTNDTNDDNFDQFYDKLRRATKQVQIKLEMTTRKKIYPCLKNLFLILQRVNMECG